MLSLVVLAAVITGAVGGVLLTPSDAEPLVGARGLAQSTGSSSTSAPEAATTTEPPGLPADGTCDAFDPADRCPPSCATAFAAMSVGTNPALSDLLDFDTAAIRLTLADGSDPVIGTDYAIAEYVVDVLAFYGDTPGQVRWAQPGPGETSQYGPDTFGVIDSATVDEDEIAAGAQFRVEEGRCRPAAAVSGDGS